MTTISHAFAQDSWRINNRLQVGSFHDNNVFESVRNTESAFVSSAIFQTQGRRNLGEVRVNYSYSNGLQFYSEFQQEHKITQIVSGDIVWSPAKNIQFTANAGGTAKFFLNAPFDFIQTYSALNVSYFLPGGFSVSLHINGNQLEYAETNQFDFFNRNYGGSLQKRLSNKLLVEGGFSYSGADFQRSAYYQSAEGLFVEKPTRQSDQYNNAFFRVTFGRHYLLRLTSEYMDNSSNSIGYAFSGMRLSVVGAARYKTKWLARMAVIAQEKKYKEDITPVNLLEFDLERSETNSAVLDISYDFIANISMLIRYSYYKNETGLRGQFYSKNLIFIGSEYRF
ncbi:MAG: hypothetical protein H6696_09185 [Deferribacteres bacterium]|nr:hypothetical protein [candidate division KSB1 bacterium]MCB9502099.1 hypothetical protein [Deferribacteres bacterium]